MTMESETENMSAGNEKFYESLPRFVTDAPVVTEPGEFLSSVERPFEWQGRKFVFTIAPARVGDFVVGETFPGDAIMSHRLPGVLEKSVEEVLRQLAVPENVNFDAGRSVLYCTSTEFVEQFAQSNSDLIVSREQLELSIETLANTNYILRESVKEFCFRPVEKLLWVEYESEFVYQIWFAPIFFNNERDLEYLLGEGIK